MQNIAEILERFQNYLDQCDIPQQPSGLYEPMRYALSLGGKRMRPLLMILAYGLYRDDIETVFDAAGGMEIFHNFTLLHDDVMDCADMRRGKPTVHCKWDVNTAILSGDGMAFIAYRYLMRVPAEHLKHVLEIADKAFMGVVEGQQHDMDFESRRTVTEDEYMEMIRLKTAVLPAAALKIGAVLGGATEAESDALYRFGEKMGLAFQLQDDMLDVYGDPKVFGKNIGGDIACNKKTYLYIMARNLADAEMNRELDEWARYNGGDAAAKYDAVRRIYDALDVRGCCMKRIDGLFADALSCVGGLRVDPSRLGRLTDYVCGMIHRQY